MFERLFNPLSCITHFTPPLMPWCNTMVNILHPFSHLQSCKVTFLGGAVHLSWAACSIGLVYNKFLNCINQFTWNCLSCEWNYAYLFRSLVPKHIYLMELIISTVVSSISIVTASGRQLRLSVRVCPKMTFPSHGVKPGSLHSKHQYQTTFHHLPR
jgi:hypothetical protein